MNEGLSGGEKKRAEVLQMAMLQPKIAIMDETDSGLDIDALRIVAESVNAIHTPEMGVLVITHYQRLLNYIKPEFVHVLFGGPDRRSPAARSWSSSSRPRATTRSSATSSRSRPSGTAREG